MRKAYSAFLPSWVGVPLPRSRRTGENCLQIMPPSGRTTRKPFPSMSACSPKILKEQVGAELILCWRGVVTSMGWRLL